MSNEQDIDSFAAEVAQQVGVSADEYQKYVPDAAWQLKNRLWQGSARSKRFQLGFVFVPAQNEIQTAVSNAMERLAPAPGGFEAVAMVESDGAGGWRVSKVIEGDGSTLGVQLKKYFTDAEIVTVLGPVVAKAAVKPGPLTAKLVDEIARQLDSSPNVILQGPPGTGKSFLAQRVSEALSGASNIAPFQLAALLKGVGGKFSSLLANDWLASLPLVWEIVQLHPGYTYDDFVRGRSLVADASGSRFESVDRVFPQLCAVAAARSTRPTLLILEEINRCSLPSVLGDLIIGIDPAHRGESVRLQLPPPADGGAGVGSLLSVPPSLKILGTMNTADRSIALVDYAIRRRFRFINVLPDAEVIREYYQVRGAEKEVQKVLALFKAMSELVDEERLRLGHSYFLCPPGEGWGRRLANRMAYEVLPMLREYLAEGRPLRSTTFVLDDGGSIDLGAGAPDLSDTSYRDLFEKFLAT